jgi:hypothetical protein
MALESKDIIKESISILMGADQRICEMVADTAMINVPIDPRIDISTITADDPDPKFVNVEVIRAGVSGNRRRYNNNVVNEVSQLIPGCQGFFGHPDPSKYGFEFREPQCIYVGSVVEQMADGLNRCIAKAYLFKTSPLREWVPKSIAAGNPMTVSINGSADVMRSGDLLDVIHMTELQSIDWANPGTEGMETSKAMSVVNEMKQNKGGTEMAENAQKIIENMTVAEFRAYNPDGYNSILKSITVQELQAGNPDLVTSIVEAHKVTEMEFVLGGKTETVKVAELQGKFDAYEQKITELENAKKTAELDAYKMQKVTEMVDEAHVETFMKRVTGDSKEAIDASIESEIAFVREMGGMNNSPAPRNPQMGDNDMQEKVRRMFGVKESK